MFLFKETRNLINKIGSQKDTSKQSSINKF